MGDLMPNMERAYLDGGRLNAMVITGGNGSADLSVLVETTAEGQGSLPGPAERAMHGIQKRVIEAAAAVAAEGGQGACETDDAIIKASMIRSGDAAQAAAITFQCNMPEGECCGRGVRAAAAILKDEAREARSTVLADPLAAFKAALKPGS